MDNRLKTQALACHALAPVRLWKKGYCVFHNSRLEKRRPYPCQSALKRHPIRCPSLATEMSNAVGTMRCRPRRDLR